MWELITYANEETDDDVRVYFLSHSETTNDGSIKCKTIGKLLDDKITLEGLFTIVLRAMKVDRKYYFSTQNNGVDTCKSPEEMFETEEIENSLEIVDNAICDYYELQK